MSFLILIIGGVILNISPGLGHDPPESRIVYGAELSEETNQNMIRYQDFGDYLRSACITHGDKVYRIDARTEKYVTWQDILHKSHRIAKFLLNAGCGKGSVIGVYCENSFEYPSILLGVLNIGATYTSVDIRLSTNDVVHNFGISKPSVIFTSTKFFESVKKNIGSVKVIVNVDDDTYPKYEGSNFEYAIMKQTDTAMISYTSGTTALPKGVMQSHKSWIFQMELYKTEKVIPFPKDNISAGLLPPGRTFELYTLLLSLVLGQKYYMIEDYDNALSYLEKYKINTFYTNPSSAAYLAKNVPVSEEARNVVKFVFVGGDFLQTESETILKRRFSCDILYFYGQTELTGFVTASFSSASHGHLMPGMKGKIVDIDSETSLGPHKLGEVRLKGPLVFSGYLGVAAGQGFDDQGWFRTGDFAYYDDDKNFHIVDRLKTLIKCQGGQVSPIELEMFLLKHPDVEDVCVVPAPDKLHDGYESPRAYVVKNLGSSITEDDIQRYVNENLSPTKSLQGGVIFKESLPKINDKNARKIIQQWVEKDG